MDGTNVNNSSRQQPRKNSNQNIQVYVRVRPLNARERCIRSAEVIEVVHPREIITRHSIDSKLTKKFTFDRTFGPDSRQVDVYATVVAPLIEEVLSGYNCTVFAYGQTGTGKTHTMVGNECAELKSSWEDDSEIGIIPRALSHLFDELRMMEVEYTMRISYLELYNEELCDLLSTDDSTKIRIFDDSTKKGSVIIQGLEEIPVHSKDDVYKLLEKGKERRKTATTLMNAQSSRSHTVFSIVVHIRENGMDGEEMLKIGKLNLVDLAGSENVTKAGNEKSIRVRETVNINQSLLTLGRVITALVERTPHIPYRESKLTRLLQESLGGRTKTSIIATISPGHKDIEETLSTLEYAHRAKNIQNKPEVNQKLTKKTVLKEYTEEIDKLKRDLMAARDKNGIYLAEETYNEMTTKMDSQNRELNEKMLLLKALKDELQNKEKIFNEVSMSLVDKTEELKRTEQNLSQTKGNLIITKKVLHSTKRRYKEKKVLVDSHVKTEKQLTTQATQILEVADLATSDTQKLHHTIERRKDVDQKIRSACENFTERMQENFEMFDGSLIQFQDKHKATTQMLNEELANCTNVQIRLLKNAENNIEQIKKVCADTIQTKSILHAEFIQIVTTLSEEQRTQLLGIFNKLSERETEITKSINANIHELENYNEQQKNTIDLMRTGIAEAIENNIKDVNAHAQQLKTQLSNISELTTKNFAELSQVQTELDNETALISQEQKAIDDFLRQMQQIKELRLKSNCNISNLISQLDSNSKSTITQVADSLDASTTFDRQCKAKNELALEVIDKQIEGALLSVDKSVAKCSTLHVQLDNLSQESSKAIADFEKKQNSYCTNLQQTCTESATTVKRLRLEREEQIEQTAQSARSSLTEEMQRVRGHIAIAEGYITDAERHLREYTTLHKNNVQTCNQDLTQFQKSELKTYAPTGTTPSKRDFIYPRILAATSPHQDIVKRYRQEHDWSDLDTTATIDECSEGEADYEANSVQEFSGTETLLNSTPVVSDMITTKRGSTASTRSSSNTLQPQQNQLRSNSFTSSTTPCKASPCKTPNINNDNKENVV